jgi:hypothetical protein
MSRPSTREREELVEDVLARLREHRALLIDGAVSIREAVQTYGIGRTDLFRRIKAREVVTIKLGKKTLIPRSSLVALLARHIAAGPKAEAAATA